MKYKLINNFLLIMLIIILLAGSILTGCSSKIEKPVISKTNNKISIVATLFPQYDFAKQIVGDKGIVTLLLPPGIESHSYEPAPSDIIKINNSNLFIYTGEYMEAWSQRIIEGMDKSSVVLDVSKGINMIETKDIVEANQHEKDENLNNKNPYDPHIWTSPINAKLMVDNILDSLCEIDPDNANYYRNNAESYIAELDGLDAEFRYIVKNGTRNKIIFGSKFALYYFTKESGLSYEAVFDSCSAETEPSAKTVAHLIDEIKEQKIPVIYYEEIAKPKVAKSISEETGAKMLLFHSCHNVTKEEFNQGANYLSLMEQNTKNLKEGLN